MPPNTSKITGSTASFAHAPILLMSKFSMLICTYPKFWSPSPRYLHSQHWFWDIPPKELGDHGGCKDLQPHMHFLNLRICNACNVDLETCLHKSKSQPSLAQLSSSLSYIYPFWKGIKSCITAITFDMICICIHKRFILIICKNWSSNENKVTLGNLLKRWRKIDFCKGRVKKKK